ncbi:MAG: D-aminoacylase [Deltaproteobacteria bacterium]|nr:D-aminoacylase [Deltaproteobacteria bacterium]MBW2122999.1 D-aminoacylase [Deltaproteobacteria bacterium]
MSDYGKGDVYNIEEERRVIETLIRNALILDGTGGRPRSGSIGISSSGRIAFVGRDIPGSNAHRVIEAEGLHALPGFVDIHSHSDLAVLDNDKASPKLMQGVTTEIVGNCGLSVVPVSPENRKEWAAQYEGVWGKLGRGWNWVSLGEYLEILQQRGLQVNLGSQVGFGAIRLAALGWQSRPASSQEIRHMEELTRRASREGSFGLSFGLVYAPACYAARRELKSVSRAAAQEDMLLNFHIRSEGETLLESIQEAIEIASFSGARLHISHLKAFGRENWNKTDRLLELIRECGLDITFDVYPYSVGSTTLNAALPPWVLEGGTEMMLRRLGSKEIRDRIREDIHHGIEGWENYLRATGAGGLMVTNLRSPGFRDFDSRFLADIMKETRRDEVDTLCDIILAEGGRASMLMHAMSEESVTRILADQRSMLGTDGLYGGMPHPRLYGTYPTFFRKYILEKRIMPLEEGVRKATGYPASRFGIKGKGLIKEGYDADILIIDMGRFDSPAGFGDSMRYAEGVEYVLVNGRVVVENGEYNNRLAGRVLRR